MSEAPVTVFQVDLHIEAEPEALWPLIIGAEHLAEWYAFGGAEIDARPGGSMRLRWDEHGEYTATIKELEPERLLSFRWEPEGEPWVEIRLEPVDGGTTVSIAQAGRMDDPELEAGAWRNSLRLLRDLAANGT